MAQEFLNPVADLEAEDFLEKVMEALKGKELCARVGLGTRKMGRPTSMCSM